MNKTQKQPISRPSILEKTDYSKSIYVGLYCVSSFSTTPKYKTGIFLPHFTMNFNPHYAGFILGTTKIYSYFLSFPNTEVIQIPPTGQQGLVYPA